MNCKETKGEEEKEKKIRGKKSKIFRRTNFIGEKKTFQRF